MTVDEYQDWLREQMMADARRMQERARSAMMSERAQRGHAQGGRSLAATAARKRAKDIPRVMELHQKGVLPQRIGDMIGRSRNYVTRIIKEQAAQ